MQSTATKEYASHQTNSINSLEHMHMEPEGPSHFRIIKTSAVILKLQYMRSKFSAFISDIIMWLHEHLPYGGQWAAFQRDWSLERKYMINLATEPFPKGAKRKVQTKAQGPCDM